MNRLTAPIIACTALLGPFLARFEAPAPTPGPGNVAVHMQRFIAALNRGDRDYLASALAEPDSLYDFSVEDGELQIAKGRRPVMMFDVDEDGMPFQSVDTAGFIARALERRGPVRSELGYIPAVCGSSNTFATMEFVRTYGEGESARSVPMRATAIVKWVDGELPNFKILHWHASVAEPVARRAGD